MSESFFSECLLQKPWNSPLTTVLSVYFPFSKHLVLKSTWCFFFLFFWSLRFSSSYFPHIMENHKTDQGESNAQRHQLATLYIILENTLPAHPEHNRISCFDCSSEVATPPDPLNSHYLGNSNFSHCLQLAFEIGTISGKHACGTQEIQILANYPVQIKLATACPSTLRTCFLKP